PDGGCRVCRETRRSLSLLDHLYCVIIRVVHQNGPPEPGIALQLGYARRDEEGRRGAKPFEGLIAVARRQRGLPMRHVIGLDAGGWPPVTGRQIFKEFDAGTGGGPEARDVEP